MCMQPRCLDSDSASWEPAVACVHSSAGHMRPCLKEPCTIGSGMSDAPAATCKP